MNLTWLTSDSTSIFLKMGQIHNTSMPKAYQFK